MLSGSQGQAWTNREYRRGHLWLNSLRVWFHAQWQVEQEGSVDILVQRVVYHCSEGDCRCGRGVHVVEFVTRVGMDGDVKRESAVFDIQPRSGVCPCNHSG